MQPFSAKWGLIKLQDKEIKSAATFGGSRTSVGVYVTSSSKPVAHPVSISVLRTCFQ